MALSNDLLLQLVKVNKEPKQPSEATALGTVVVDGRTYVKLDGSDLLTPVNTTSAVKDGDRVNVLIKNHTATVTGNMSDPSASGIVVEAQGKQISEFEVIVAHKIKVDELEAIHAVIGTLEADLAKIGKLEAVEAEIEHLKAGLIEADRVTATDIEAINATIENLTATFGTFDSITTEDLEALYAEIGQLKAYTGDFTFLSTEVLEAIKGNIKELDVGKLSADEAKIIYATIDELNATNANITNLNADVGKIDTLIFGSASGNVIQSEFANAVVSQISQAQIKDAMIDSVSAGKIMAGDIYTNNVRVMSEDGQLLIADETIQISDDNRVRVQIGKDASNDYSINIWDAEGNLMFSEGGITENAVKNAIIRDDMVSDNANIQAGKLDISSLFREINDSTETIKSNKIFLDSENQTLEVAFTQMSSDVDGLSADVESQGTAITVLEGQIKSKVWLQDIGDILGDGVEGTVVKNLQELRTQYTELEQEVDSISATVGDHRTLIDKNSGAVVEVSNKVTEVEADLDGFRSTVSNTYATKGDLEESVSRTESKINQTNESIESVVSQIETIDNKFDGYSTTEQMNSAIEQKANAITQTVSQTYATKNSLDNYYTKSETGSVIEQKANEISLSVTNARISEIDIGGRNLLLNSSFAENLDEWSVTGANIVTIDGVSCARISGALAATRTVSQSVLDKIDSNDPDQTYVFGADVKLDNFVPGTTNPFVRLYFNGRYDNNGVDTWTGGTWVSGDPNIATHSDKGWVRISATIKFDHAPNVMYCQISARDFTGDLYFKNLKLEKGNKATDWTPAPEDVEADILEATDEIRDDMIDQNTAIVQSCESIIMTALESYTKTSDHDEFEATVMSQLALLSTELSLRFTETNTRLEAANGELQNQLNTITKYFTFDVDGMTIGQTDSLYKVVIDNDRYSMLVNDVEVMWIANGEVHTPELTVTDKFRLLGLMMDIDSNGNINCEYVGT